MPDDVLQKLPKKRGKQANSWARRHGHGESRYTRDLLRFTTMADRGQLLGLSFKAHQKRIERVFELAAKLRNRIAHPYPAYKRDVEDGPSLVELREFVLGAREIVEMLPSYDENASPF